MRKIYSIHPAIGMARVGDSGIDHAGRPTPEMYFVGPEAPGFDFVPDGYDRTPDGDGVGAYRDRNGALRRQGARFRIYEKTLDVLGQVVSVREINNKTPGVTKITWTVHLANRKASAERFPPYYHDLWGDFGPIRNPGITPRGRLDIDTGPQQVTDSTTANKRLVGKFDGRRIKLGDSFTDEDGRLIVLGGHGKIYDATNLGNPVGLPQLLYNHDGVCDDTSDGKITATIKFEGQSPMNIDQPDQYAWVIVAPPNHAPAVQSVITLYDVVFNANLSKLSIGDDRAIPAKVSFTRDIYPLLRRTVDFQYVSARTRMGHSGEALGNFFRPDRIERLSTKPFDPDHKRAREHFFSRLTTENARQQEIDMPFLYGGVYPESPQRKPQDWLRPSDSTSLDYRDRTSLDAFGKPLTITNYQRQVLKKWVEGLFEEDWPGSPPPYRTLDELEERERPDALDEAALEHGSGGSFHPGIEAPYQIVLPVTFGHWFRLSPDYDPGELTMGMSLPWQTDFRACSELWWPAQRPNSVPVLADGNVTHKEWTRSIDPWVEWADAIRVLELGVVKRDPETQQVLEAEPKPQP